MAYEPPAARVRVLPPTAMPIGALPGLLRATLLGGGMIGPLVRYGMVGATVAGVLLGLPLALNAGFGLPLEVAIPFGYLAALTLHFTLQRFFVWRHIEVFALSHWGQIGRYAMMAAVQYPTTAVATAVLPGALGVPERLVYVATVAVVTVASFFVLRFQIFHAAETFA